MRAVEDRIGRLELHGMDRAAASVCAAELAADLELQPRGLPAEAILLVRRLQARWSGRDPRRERARAVEQAVAECAQRAVRPWSGAVDPSAEAVWFASRAELLACLALDAIARRQPWWWSWLGLDPAIFPTAWQQAPEVVPGVMAQLAARDALPAVLARVTATQARALAASVVATWSLPGILALVQQVPIGAFRRSMPVGPWRTWWQPGPSAAGPAPAAELFAGIALGLHRAANRVRSAAFARDLAAWIEVCVAPPAAMGVGSDGAGIAPATAVVPVATAGPGPTTSHEPDAPAVPRDATPAGPDAVVPAAPTQDEPVDAPRGSPFEARTEPTGPAPTASGPVLPLEGSPTAGEPQSARAPSAMGSIAASAPDPGPDVGPTPWSCRTRLGGLFYLVNVLLDLDVYGDFTRPHHPDPGVPLWDCVAGLGRRLLRQRSGRAHLTRRWPRHARAAPPWASDPIWARLGSLAGHAPRVRCQAPDPAWNWPDAVQALLRRPGRRPDARWLDALALAVRRRLGRRLPVPPRRWLVQRAEVVGGTERLAVTFRLATHPVRIRAAGLDRDPGWIGSAGIDLRFHYVG